MSKPTVIQEKQYRFKQELLNQGLPENIRDVDTASLTDDVPPMPVAGKPLSEMIIEDRR